MTAQGFRVAPERDEDWRREAWRETVRSVLVTEQRAFVANVLSVAGIAIAASFLPNASAFVMPILMRLLAMTGAHMSYEHLRKRIDQGADLDPPLRLLAVMLFFGGMSWAYLLLPLIMVPFEHPVRLLIGSATMVGMALIVTMTAPLRKQTLAYISGFLITLFLGLMLAPQDMALPLGIGVTALVAGIAIFAFASSRQREFSADMLVENRRLNEELAETLAQAEFLAAHDPLTGLFNRRALFESDLAARAQCDRMHMLLVDLDHFKTLNDSHGHESGDRALVAVSGLMRDSMRGYGAGEHFAVRLGGEEFALFLDEGDEGRSLVFAEDLREAIAGLHAELGLPAGATSASIGLTHHDRGTSMDETLRRADEAMYDAKIGGRNRVRRHDR
ncbi:GGDEF domain-containing protein [Qipengyuania sp. 6B39]|uniref:GGDEF domain-containing protein n=1 Tax=Qipengyuania proteolytica TaxID=2867239 RepID=UPI001C8A3C26|nr:GGDEF domain-containing protein [Qipengyuania proteolytica]MBX7496465.1 GGDEF domain-containing protein [Qipengyuania proteolytica]